MSQISPFLRSGPDGYHSHWCAGCEQMHVIPNGWAFDGNVDSPTFTPSVCHTWDFREDKKCCHYNVTAGRVTFHPDCTHWLAGSIVDLPRLPDDYTGEKWHDGGPS